MTTVQTTTILSRITATTTVLMKGVLLLKSSQ